MRIDDVSSPRRSLCGVRGRSETFDITFDITDRARAHGHGPVRAEAPRASVRDARVSELDRVRRRREIRAHRERQQRGRGDHAEADQAPTRLRARVASAAPSLRVAPGLVHERALAAAAREGVSERRPPVRDVGRFRASAQPPPLLRVAKRHRRDVAAEERRALETRRRASSCHRETGGGVLSRSRPSNGERWWLSEREKTRRVRVLWFFN